MVGNMAWRWTPASLAHGSGRMLVVAALTILASSVPTPKNADAAEVADILRFCSSCHGPQGQSIAPNYPRLAGQQKDYIAAQLQNFRDGTRTAPHTQNYLDYLAMWGLVVQLTPPTADAIAAFYASQPPVAGQPSGSPEVAFGRRIYTEGIPSENVPACTGCHGVTAQGNGPIPRLAGQYQGYLARQLEAFASWQRQNVTMHANSVNLTPEQINEVTAYLATL